MAENRLKRELDTRETAERTKQWRPAELLPEPDKEAGFKYRWIRVSMNGQSDARNLSRAIREGWEPVRIEEQPRMKLLVDPNSRFKDNIEIGGLVLCKTPEELVDQRNKYYADQTKAQTDAVDNNLMRENDPRMPLFNERKTNVSFGKGK
jgi:hypothetical protein